MSRGVGAPYTPRTEGLKFRGISKVDMEARITETQLASQLRPDQTGLLPMSVVNA